MADAALAKPATNANNDPTMIPFWVIRNILNLSFADAEFRPGYHAYRRDSTGAPGASPSDERAGRVFDRQRSAYAIPLNEARAASSSADGATPNPMVANAVTTSATAIAYPRPEASTVSPGSTMYIFTRTPA